MLRKLFLGLSLLLLMYGCTQEEGIGGSCHITGVLVERIYNDDYSILLEERIPADEDVYIAFGSASTSDKKTSTGFAGNFEFNYLWPGKYSLFYFTEDSLNSKEEVPKIITVELKGKETRTLDTLYINRTADWNDGTSTISGRVTVINYKNSSEYPFLVIKDIGPAQEQEVYITYGNHLFYDERIRTQDDGTFHFTNLIKGKYRVFLYSENIRGTTTYDVISFNKEITEERQKIDLGEIFIEKL